jgi:2-keto-4-pentenoate hydratase/2-oxohepta-3-ene-1,7-dioic acid hydratase in catechol pathway
MRIANVAGRLAIVSGDGFHDVETASRGAFSADPQAVFNRWRDFVAWAASRSWDGAHDGDVLLEELRAPVPRPRQVFGIGLNYAAHANEAGLEVSEAPTVFAKFPTCIGGPAGTIELSGPTVDWEVELVVVIGVSAHRIPPAEAWSHIAGLTIGQDLSDRHVQFQGTMPQFNLAKSFPGFGPLGPLLVTPDEFDDPNDLALGCRLNGEVVQEARTSELLRPVAEVVSYLSGVVPLQPGDVIFTGTPDGIGAARKPPLYLKPGDELESWIEGIGVMRHTFAAVASTPDPVLTAA